MAGSVQLLAPAASTATPSKASKPAATDDAGDSFKSELDRASDRQRKVTDDSSDDKNSTKSTAAKKTQSKDKTKKPAADGTDEADDADDTDSTDAKADPTAAKNPTAASTLPDDESAAATDGVPAPVKKAAAAKAKPVTADPTLAAAATVAPKAVTADASTANAATAAASESNDSAAVATATQSEAAAATDPAALAAAAHPDASADASPDAAADPQAKIALPDLPDAELDSEQVAAEPKAATVKTAVKDLIDAATDEAQTITQFLSDAITAAADLKPHDAKPSADASTSAAAAIAPTTAAKTAAPALALAKPEQVQTPPETRFAENNHADIVKGIQTQLLPRGGTMQLRLDPPELGALQVTLSMKDGVMNATFQTSNDDATRLLSHSLSQLKTAMESAGVTVDKIQVQHTPRDTQAHTGDDQQRGQPGQDDMSRQQEQQRKEMIKRMWRKLSGESDPLDMVA